MNSKEALENIDEIRNMQDILTSHYVMLFYDHSTGNVVAYDAADPFKCYNAITKAHLDYEFTVLYPCPSINSARDIVKCFSTVNKMRPRVLSKLDPTFKLTIQSYQPATLALRAPEQVTQ